MDKISNNGTRNFMNCLVYIYVHVHKEKHLLGEVAISFDVIWEEDWEVACGNSTSPHLRWKYGRGRFSGTMVSSEFTRQGGHVLLSLHLSTLMIGFVATVSCCKSHARAICSWLITPKLIISRPTMTVATPNKHDLCLWLLGLDKGKQTNCYS